MINTNRVRIPALFFEIRSSQDENCWLSTVAKAFNLLCSFLVFGACDRYYKAHQLEVSPSNFATSNTPPTKCRLPVTNTFIGPLSIWCMLATASSMDLATITVLGVSEIDRQAAAISFCTLRSVSILGWVATQVKSDQMMRISVSGKRGRSDRVMCPTSFRHAARKSDVGRYYDVGE